MQWLLSLCIVSLVSATSWGFDDATVSVHGKKAGVGAGLKEKYGVIVSAIFGGISLTKCLSED